MSPSYDDDSLLHYLTTVGIALGVDESTLDRERI